MKPGDKFFAVFQDYDIVPVRVRNVGIRGEGAHVLRKGQNSNEARYFQNKWLFKSRSDAIKNCMTRLQKKIEKNVEFYNMLNAQIADAILEELLAKKGGS